MSREIDQRDCQHGHADSQQDEIDRLRAEVAKWQRSFADAFQSEYSEAKARVVLELERDKLRAERDALREELTRAVGKTAERCREMAMWPQGIDDEQAYYGRMFAEFIEKEFKVAIDAAKKP
jgi:ElaB/YqjD/DUF883 family membrane-anchored ribosome-binding protein